MEWFSKLKSEVRERYGNQLNAASALGVSQKAMSNWCRGKAFPTPENRYLLETAFGDLGIPPDPDFDPDAMTFDIHLAEMRIEEIVRQINGLAPLCHTLEEIAGGVFSRERVRQIEATAMAKIAKRFTPDELQDILELRERDDAEQVQTDIRAVQNDAHEYHEDIGEIRSIGWKARRQAV